MSEFQMVSESELQCIELSDAELQNIEGGVPPIVIIGLLAMGFEIGVIGGILLADYKFSRRRI